MVRFKPLFCLVVSAGLALSVVLTALLAWGAHIVGGDADIAASRPLGPVPSLAAGRRGSFVSQVEISGAADPSGPSKALPDRPVQCRMDNCFDYARCLDSFRVYVYPVAAPVSPSYAKIVRSLKSSVYYTDNPHEACIFVLALDTLDRDPLSRDWYVRSLAERLAELPYWNGGRNHIIFNLYSGTWPDYSEHLDFDYGYAMLAKASISTHNFRPNFDISLPLFHDVLAEKGGEPGKLGNLNVPSNDKYLLAFKGKRYLVGIGSETRNFVHHLHNGKDIIMLTTCRHGKDWERYKDDRCDVDNEAYDRYSYEDLLENATFCLVPRGRRLGSFRFLESLQYVCIPVIASDNWELPFSEVIDWKKATIWSDERLVFQVPDVVRSVPIATVMAMQQQLQFLWDAYFSSIDKIVATTLEILKDRILPHAARSALTWNTHPGAHYVLPSYSRDIRAFPFSTSYSTQSSFVALISVRHPSELKSQAFARLVEGLAASKYLQKVVLFVDGDLSVPVDWWPSSRVPATVRSAQAIKDASSLDGDLDTDAVFHLDAQALLITEEIDFAFSVWRSYPERVVGFSARAHLFDEREGRWLYTSKWANEYSMVLTGAAIYHRYYRHLMIRAVNASWRETSDACSDIFLNALVSHVTKLPPVKVTQRKHHVKPVTAPVVAGASPPLSSANASWAQEVLATRSRCLSSVVDVFGYMPLRKSRVRLDPCLFKDPVAMWRKRYQRLEKAV